MEVGETLKKFDADGENHVWTCLVMLAGMPAYLRLHISVNAWPAILCFVSNICLQKDQ